MFKTDNLGRIKSVEGQIDLTTAARNGYQQGKVGKSGAAGDEGGHLIASIFNGPGEKLNLVPMNGNFNKGAWKAMENDLAAATKAGKKVEVKIDVIYDAVNRPAKFTVTHTIDGVKTDVIFRNRPGG
jgi:filamentous hemagglutinin